MGSCQAELRRKLQHKTTKLLSENPPPSARSRTNIINSVLVGCNAEPTAFLLVYQTKSSTLTPRYLRLRIMKVPQK